MNVHSKQFLFAYLVLAISVVACSSGKEDEVTTLLNADLPSTDVENSIDSQDATADHNVAELKEIEEVSTIDSTDVPAEASETTIEPDVFKCKDNNQCNTNNPCTQDWCNVGTGECQQTILTDHVCSDGNACTENDLCSSSGKCIGGSAKNCDDLNPCTTDICDQIIGCAHENTDKSCSDGSVCTKDDVCVFGLCTGIPIVCDDGNDCTLDSCDKATGCVFEKLNNVPCDDNSACTQIDLCAVGVCKGSPVNCGDSNPCTIDTCDKLTGCFSYPAQNGSKCSDGNACTLNDHCQDSICLAGSAKSCDDSNICTKDSCDSTTGECLNEAVAGIFYCNDFNACTYDDTCKLGVCTGKILQCYDGNDCTQDTCDKGLGCVFTVMDKAPCNDGDACTIGDTCFKDKCVGNVKTCTDSNDCTIDTCDPATGKCNFTANDGYYCDDSNACTIGDVCKGIKCVGNTILCNDGNSCTDDGCNAKTGCVFTPTPNAPCDDGDACTTGDICNKTVCSAKPIVCNDNNTCTKDSCDKTTGKCVFQPYKDGVACNDADPCTTGDICMKGTCDGTFNTCEDWNICTIDACEPKTGQCTYTPIPNCFN